MDKVKVAVESYQEYRIKEITNDGREILIPADTLASYFAGLVERFQFVERDPVFNEAQSQSSTVPVDEPLVQQQLPQQQQQLPVENGDEAQVKSEPVQTAAPQSAEKEKSRPTLEVVKRNLQNALTEFTVLSDLLVIAARANKWIVLDRIANAETPSDSLNALVAAVKRAGLQSAHRHLSHANDQLITAYRQSTHPGSFVNQLVKLRQRWRMRRTAAGVPVGDLSFCSVGSRFGSIRPPSFEVVQLDSSPNEATDGGIDVILPPGLDVPVSISLLLSDPDDPQLSDIVGTNISFASNSRNATVMEAKLLQAQQNLFYEELFATMANDALQQRVGDHQVVVTRDSLTCRLSPTSRAVLTIALTRGKKENSEEFLKDRKPMHSVQSSISRSLLLSAMSLLRKMHNENLQQPTLPTIAPLNNTSSSSEKKSILAQIVDQARYIVTRRKLERKLDRLASDVRINYAARLVVHWSAITSPTFCTARMTVFSSGYDYSRTFSMLIVDVDNVRVVAKDGSVFEIDEELQLLRIHVGELVHDYFIECGQRMAAAAGLVPRNQRSAVGLSSLRLLIVTHPSFSNELCVLLSPDGPPQVRIRNTFYQSVVDRSEQNGEPTAPTAAASSVSDSAYIDLSFLPGSSFLDKLQNLLSIFSLKQ